MTLTPSLEAFTATSTTHAVVHLPAQRPASCSCLGQEDMPPAGRPLAGAHFSRSRLSYRLLPKSATRGLGSWS